VRAKKTPIKCSPVKVVFYQVGVRLKVALRQMLEPFPSAQLGMKKGS